jgi:hypothetical protein
LHSFPAASALPLVPTSDIVPAKQMTVVRAGEPGAQRVAGCTMSHGTRRASDLARVRRCQRFVSLSLALRQICRILYFFCHRRHAPLDHICCARLAPAGPK